MWENKLTSCYDSNTLVFEFHGAERKILDYPSGPDLIMCVHVKSLQLCPTLCDSVDCSQPGAFVLEILQARILEWFVCPPPGNLPDPGIKPISPALGGKFFATDITWEAQYDHNELDKRDREGIRVSGDGYVKQRLNVEIQKWKHFNLMKLILDF